MHRRLAALTLALATLPGCSVHHYDPATGVEHIWGFGHVQVKVAHPDEGVRAVFTSAQTLGLTVGTGASESYLAAGWHQAQSLRAIDEDTAVSIDFGDDGLLDARVGSAFPQPVRPKDRP